MSDDMVDEEVYVYFNDELPQDFENLMSKFKIVQEALGDLILTVPVDMEVASPEDDVLNVFGGHCLEISEALASILEDENKTRKRLKEVEKKHEMN